MSGENHKDQKFTFRGKILALSLAEGFERVTNDAL